MSDHDEHPKNEDTLGDDALRAKLLELKARVASLHQRVATLEQKKRDVGGKSTPGRS